MNKQEVYESKHFIDKFRTRVKISQRQNNNNPTYIRPMFRKHFVRVILIKQVYIHSERNGYICTEAHTYEAS